MTGISLAPTEGVSLFMYCFTIIMTGISTLKMIEMPVFRPNEYFWKNHWDGKEDKWITYARAVRAVMAEHSGMEVSDT